MLTPIVKTETEKVLSELIMNDFKKDETIHISTAAAAAEEKELSTEKEKKKQTKIKKGSFILLLICALVTIFEGSLYYYKTNSQDPAAKNEVYVQLIRMSCYKLQDMPNDISIVVDESNSSQLLFAQPVLLHSNEPLPLRSNPCGVLHNKTLTLTQTLPPAATAASPTTIPSLLKSSKSFLIMAIQHEKTSSFLHCCKN